jgi:hypothetical protein
MPFRGSLAPLRNLQCKIYCQNSGETNEHAAKLLGERWVQAIGISTGTSRPTGMDTTTSAGVNISDRRQYYLEPSAFTTLKRGGPKNDYQVESVVYNGGTLFVNTAEPGKEELLPYTILTFKQRGIRIPPRLV